jgi:hypothetical protein
MYTEVSLQLPAGDDVSVFIRCAAARPFSNKIVINKVIEIEVR